ncbi:MAG: ribbon-helix-helix protein, CopG family [Anaerolineae bacterium]|nr:ribbon-helix-helix protein, CopG family [Anaerolineae bacterium]
MTDALREDLLQRLDELARAEHRSLNDFVEDLLLRYVPSAPSISDPEIEALPPGSFARLGAAGRGMPPIGEPDDTSERADEILRNEFADYLLARMNRPPYDP